MDEPPQDSSQPTQPNPPTARQGPVTRLSKVAGIIILFVGLGLTAYGGYGVVWSATSDSSLKAISVFIASVVLVIGLPALIGGIGILRGAEWGRGIGILYSVSLGLVSLDWTIANILGPGNFLSTLLFGLTFVLFCTYSAIELIARWRGPAIA